MSAMSCVRRKLSIAMAFGAFLGLICSLFHILALFSSSNSFFFFFSFCYHGTPCSTYRDTANKIPSSEADTNALVKEVTLLKMQLKFAKQERDTAQNQLLALGSSRKAGSIRNLRANHVVQSNQSANEELAKLLVSLTPNKELIVGIADNNHKDLVSVWSSSIKKANITNYLLIALDDLIAEFCQLNHVPFYRKEAGIAALEDKAETDTNYAISVVTFPLLREFLVLGYSVLFSHVDVVFFQNPFLHLYKDCDVEAMSDGHSNETAYGFDDVSDDPKMGWSRYAHTMRIWLLSSGFFYIKPTIPSFNLLDRVSTRLSNEKAWDQAVFNEELFFPSHPGYEGLHASKRVMDYYLFMNSKVMFTKIRNDSSFDSLLPVAIHVNCHFDKFERMLALIEYYTEGKKGALKSFPDGSD